MVVDNDPVVLELFEALQSFHDMKVVEEAKDGDDALNKYCLLSPPPDVILMNERMPHMSGIDCMSEILKINPEAKIIVIAADIQVKQAAFAAGAMAFVPKPFLVSDLIDTVLQVMKE